MLKSIEYQNIKITLNFDFDSYRKNESYKELNEA